MKTTTHRPETVGERLSIFQAIINPLQKRVSRQWSWARNSWSSGHRRPVWLMCLLHTTLLSWCRPPLDRPKRYYPIGRESEASAKIKEAPSAFCFSPMKTLGIAVTRRSSTTMTTSQNSRRNLLVHCKMSKTSVLVIPCDISRTGKTEGRRRRKLTERLVKIGNFGLTCTPSC